MLIERHDIELLHLVHARQTRTSCEPIMHLRQRVAGTSCLHLYPSVSQVRDETLQSELHSPLARGRPETNPLYPPGHHEAAGFETFR